MTACAKRGVHQDSQATGVACRRVSSLPLLKLCRRQQTPIFPSFLSDGPRSEPRLLTGSAAAKPLPSPSPPPRPRTGQSPRSLLPARPRCLPSSGHLATAPGATLFPLCRYHWSLPPPWGFFVAGRCQTAKISVCPQRLHRVADLRISVLL